MQVKGKKSQNRNFLHRKPQARARADLMFHFIPENGE